MGTGGYYGNNINYTISNGYPPFSVELKNSGLPINIHNEFGTHSFTGITAGTYILNVIDDKNCEYSANIVISGHPVPVVSILKFINVSVVDVVNNPTPAPTQCNLSVTISSPSSNIIELSNFVSSNPSVNNYNISIDSGATNIISLNWGGGTYQHSELEAGTYTVTVTDLSTNNCLVTETIVVEGGDIIFNIGSGFDYSPLCAIETSDGGYLIGGSFNSYNSVGAKDIIKLRPNGTIDPSFVYGGGFDSDGFVNAVSESSDGGYFIGGYFPTYNAQSVNNFVKLKSDGSIDPLFNMGTGFNNYVQTIISNSDGSCIVGGAFTTYSGQTVNNIVKLKSDGYIDTSFTIDPLIGDLNGVNCIFQTSDNNYLIGGWKLYKIDPYGTLLGNFNNFSSQPTIVTIAEDQDGKYLIGGAFTTYDGEPRINIVKILSNGDIDPQFTTGIGFNNYVRSITITPNNTYLIGGFFTEYNTSVANRIIELYYDGTIYSDSLTNDGTAGEGEPIVGGFNEFVRFTMKTSHDTYLIGGTFTEFNGVPYGYIVNIGLDGTSYTTT